MTSIARWKGRPCSRARDSAKRLSRICHSKHPFPLRLQTPTLFSLENVFRESGFVFGNIDRRPPKRGRMALSLPDLSVPEHMVRILLQQSEAGAMPGIMTAAGPFLGTSAAAQLSLLRGHPEAVKALLVGDKARFLGPLAARHEAFLAAAGMGEPADRLRRIVQWRGTGAAIALPPQMGRNEESDLGKRQNAMVANLASDL